MSSKKTSKSPTSQDRRAGTGLGMGDYYGTGAKNPVGKMRSSSVGIRPVSNKGLKTPPKKVA